MINQLNVRHDKISKIHLDLNLTEIGVLNYFKENKYTIFQIRNFLIKFY